MSELKVKSEGKKSSEIRKNQKSEDKNERKRMKENERERKEGERESQTRAKLCALLPPLCSDANIQFDIYFYLARSRKLSWSI